MPAGEGGGEGGEEQGDCHGQDGEQHLDESVKVWNSESVIV